ncbi:MAG: hypothetical protein H6Q07_609 [Acidobacteria bacterium]|nr:hypothetical protein [Acidobacteriota bacterium]
MGLLSYWANSYWGAAHAAIGGVLLLGAVPGIVKKPGKVHAVAVGLGLLILANSRPFEGLVFALGMAALGVLKFRQSPGASSHKTFRLLIPLCLAILIPGALAAACYNHQVTGNWMRMPQQENMSCYGLAMLPWQSMHAERIPRIKHMQAFYELQRERFRNFFTVTGFFKDRFKVLCQFWSFYISPLLTLPLLLFLSNWRTKRCFPLLIAGLIFSSALIINPWFFPHYFSPAFGLLWLIAIMGLRIMHGFRVGNRGSRPFLLFVRLVPICMTAAVAASVWGPSLGLFKPPSDESRPTWHYTGPGNTQRARLVSQLEALPGKHLVLIRYARKRDLLVDWVYNAADIDSSDIVFAHDFGQAGNQRLLQYYSDRQVWAVNIDLSPETVQKMRNSIR